MACIHIHKLSQVKSKDLQTWQAFVPVTLSLRVPLTQLDRVLLMKHQTLRTTCIEQPNLY